MCAEIFSEAWCRGEPKHSGQGDVSLVNKQTKTTKHKTRDIITGFETCGALRVTRATINRKLTPIMINLNPTLKTQEKELCVHFYPQNYLTQSLHARQLSTIKYEVKKKRRNKTLPRTRRTIAQ